jgi:hypothetical protein
MKKTRSSAATRGGPEALARLEGLMDRTASRLEALRAREAQRLQDLARDRDRLKRQLEERALPHGVQLWEWVERVHADGSAARVRRLLQRLETFSDSALMLGPLGEEGGNARGRTGDYWASLRLDLPGIDVSERTGPAWGCTVAVRAAADFQKVPPGVVEGLAEGLKTGAAWGRIIGDLSRKIREHARLQQAGVQMGVRRLQADVRELRRAVGRRPER